LGRQPDIIIWLSLEALPVKLLQLRIPAASGLGLYRRALNGVAGFLAGLRRLIDSGQQLVTDFDPYRFRIDYVARSACG
jgi:hypothetical protein